MSSITNAQYHQKHRSVAIAYSKCDTIKQSHEVTKICILLGLTHLKESVLDLDVE